MKQRIPDWALKQASDDLIKNPKMALWVAGFIVLLGINLQLDILMARRGALVRPTLVQDLEQIMKDLEVLADAYVAYVKSLEPPRQE